MKRSGLIAAMAVVLAGGCGPSVAKVKGRLVDNGAPMTFPPTTVAIELSPIGADGKAEGNTVYSAVVQEDGGFEVVASGGTLPPGTYRVGIIATGKSMERLK